MNKVVILFLLITFVACNDHTHEKSFISSDLSYSKKFYFISSDNQLDHRRPVVVVCANMDTGMVIDKLETSGFDSVDYVLLDRPLDVNNRIDSSLHFPDHVFDSLCINPICIQLKDDLKVLFQRKLAPREIEADERLTSFQSTCVEMDHGTLYELETEQQEKYSVYHLVLYKSCEYLDEHVLLFKDSKLINHQDR